MDTGLLVLAVIILILAIVEIVNARGRALLGWLAIYVVLPRIVEFLERFF